MSDLEDIVGRNPDNETKARNIAGARLKSLVERIENVESARRELAEDVKEIYIEVKSAGFDVPVVRELIKLRRKDPKEASEQADLLDVYRAAVGM